MPVQSPPLPSETTVAAERLGPILDELRSLAVRIDLEGHYPAAILPALGRVGALGHHLSEESDFSAAVAAIAAVGGECGSTAFLTWCHGACGWYVHQSCNAALRERWLPALAAGETIGATALSNPMKNAAGIEPLRLSGTRHTGGYTVRGQLPWVSNLVDDGVFAFVFKTGQQSVMALLPVNTPGLTRRPTPEFAALEGTATYALHFDNVEVRDEDVLADPAAPFLKQVRSGFVLLQVGIALGIAGGAIQQIRHCGEGLAHTNVHLPDDAEGLEEELVKLQQRIPAIAAQVAEREDVFLDVAALRLDAALFSQRTAQAALWHRGAIGFLRKNPAQRRIREALFVGLLTPSLKHLHQLLKVRYTAEVS